jgi:hypothetical protein
MKFYPPFDIDADYYDANGKELEWAHWWGECKDAARVEWYVEDTRGKRISTHRTREKAEAALERLRSQ